MAFDETIVFEWLSIVKYAFVVDLLGLRGGVPHQPLGVPIGGVVRLLGLGLTHHMELYRGVRGLACLVFR